MLELDNKLTLLINNFHSSYFDDVFYVYSGKLFWLPLAMVIIYAIVKSYGKQSVIPLLFIFLLILLADQISSSFFKPYFERLRPSHDPQISPLIHNVNGYKGGLYGFISSHSANAFAFAVFSALLFRNNIYTILIFSWAILTAYSRVYLGVHFVGDILIGGLVGTIIAVGLYYIMLVVEKKSKFTRKIINHKFINIILGIYIFSLLLLLCGAKYLIFTH